jgi:hypothetical protein
MQAQPVLPNQAVEADVALAALGTTLLNAKSLGRSKTSLSDVQEIRQREQIALAQGFWSVTPRPRQRSRHLFDPRIQQERLLAGPYGDGPRRWLRSDSVREQFS